MKIASLPEFKGYVTLSGGPESLEERRLYQAIITGMKPGTDTPLTPPEYLLCLRQVAALQTAIAQNVGRIFAMALFNADSQRQHFDSEPHFLEGCLWDWGTSNPLKGADISHSIYKNVVPGVIKTEIIDPIVLPITKRTRDEFQHIFVCANQSSANQVVTITDSYHQLRSELIGEFVRKKEGHKQMLCVKTPQEIAHSWM